MDLVVAVQNHQQVAHLLVTPFTAELGRAARDHLLQTLPQFLGVFLHQLLHQVHQQVKEVTFKQLYKNAFQFLTLGTQRGGVAEEEKLKVAANRTARQAICYALWKENQVAPPEELIDDNYVIQIEEVEAGRITDTINEIYQLPMITADTKRAASPTSPNSNIYNPLYQAAQQSEDSLGISPHYNSAPYQTNTPPHHNQAGISPKLGQFMAGAAAGYVGAKVSQNPYNLPPTKLPDPYEPTVGLPTSDNINYKRKHRKLAYTYDGIGELEAFTFITAYHQASYRDKWSDYDKVAYFPDHLTGKALQWYTLQFGNFNPDFLSLKQEFLETFSPQQNPLFYTARLRNTTKQHFATVQAYTAKFEEVLRTTPRNMVAQHDAIQLFLMELPESLKMELTLQPYNTIAELIARAKFIVNNRTCFLGKELAIAPPRSTQFNKAASYSNKPTAEFKQKPRKNNRSEGTNEGKFCTYHKSKTHSNAECRYQQQAKSGNSNEHHIDVVKNVEQTDNKPSNDIHSYHTVHVGLNAPLTEPIPLAAPVVNNNGADFLWTTASAATVTVAIDEIPITAILDTGCAGVTLSTRLLAKIKQKPEPVYTTSVYTAERNITTNLGFKKFKFQLGNETIYCPAIILPSDSYDMLLSTNILSQLQAKIDFATSLMTLPNSKVPFKWKPIQDQTVTTAYIAPLVDPPKLPAKVLHLQTNQDQPAPKVKYFQLYPQINTSFSPSQGTLYINSAHPVKLEPQQHLKVATGLTIDIPEGNTGLICNYHWSTQMGLLVVPGMLYPRTYSNLTLLIVNQTQKEIEIPPNQRIAILQLLTTPNITFEREVTAPSAFTVDANPSNQDNLPSMLNSDNNEKNIAQAEKLLEHLEPTAQTQFLNVMKEFSSIFQNSLRKPGAIPSTTHVIETGDATPFRSKAYTRSHHDIKVEHEEIQKMLEAGVIVPSKSPWTSPVVLVTKKDGSVIFCVDYRRLNQITKKDAYPLPRIDLMLEKFHNIQYFTTLDLTSGYWQVPMDPKSKEKTAFTSNHGIYEFNVMPFGLTNAPSSFQR